MTYTYDLNTNGCLIIKADDRDRERLKEIRGPVGEYGQTERPYVDIEYEALEPLICNSELEWIAPEDIGALTSAPILGIRNTDPIKEDPTSHEYPIVAAWGFMDYAVRSFVDDLIETGKAVFIS